MADTETNLDRNLAKVKARRDARAAERLREESRSVAEAELADTDAVKKADAEQPSGFFSSFFGRAETIDQALNEAQRTRQSTDSSQ